MTRPPDPTLDLVPARRWLAAAMGSLLAAGALALVLVACRTPGMSWLPLDPAFFRRCLVVHVDLALIAWLVAFILALWCCLPGPAVATGRGGRGAVVAGLGMIVLCASALVPGAEPVLSNYVPAIDHPLFSCGLVLLAGGAMMGLLDGRLLSPQGGRSALHVPQSFAILLRGAAVALIVAVVTFAASAVTLPAGLVPLARWERLAWGGGHVLQFAAVAAMLACWQVLVERAGGEPMGPRLAGILTAVLTAPLLLAPVLALRTDGGRQAFTRLMEIGIAPVVLVAMACGARSLLRRPRGSGGGGHAAAFAASAGLTLLGFGLGLAIIGSSTMVPAHYHAAIGGVTASFMAVTPLLLPALGFGTPGRRARSVARWQPVAFAAGQAVFAAGFALAGAHGMARKVHAVEQSRGLAETLGMAVMAAGGLVAAAAGLLFVAIATSAIARSLAQGRLQPRTPPLVPAASRPQGDSHAT